MSCYLLVYMTVLANFPRKRGSCRNGFNGGLKCIFKFVNGHRYGVPPAYRRGSVPAGN